MMALALGPGMGPLTLGPVAHLGLEDID